MWKLTWVYKDAPVNGSDPRPVGPSKGRYDKFFYILFSIDYVETSEYCFYGFDQLW